MALNPLAGPGRGRALAAVYLLLAVTPLRGWLEAGMVSHMLVQLPLLVGIGALAVRWLPPRLHNRLDRCNAAGAPLTLLALFAAAFWMLPRSLDAALNQPAMELAKFVSLPLLIGAPLALSWQRLPAVGRGFLWSNLLSMLVVLGCLYSAAPVRVCTNYLVDQQQLLGRGLLLLALGLAVWLAGRVLFGGGPGHAAPRRPAGWIRWSR